MTHTEQSLQLRLWQKYGSSRELWQTNVYIYGNNESDFLTLTKAGYTDEYEIKVTRSDFKADALKDRHLNYQRLSPWRVMGEGGLKTAPYTAIQKSSMESRHPNRFWYVAPEGIIALDDLPPYAGLIVLADTGFLEVRQRAPMLHKNKAPDWIQKKILKVGYFRNAQHQINNFYDR